MSRPADAAEIARRLVDLGAVFDLDRVARAPTDPRAVQRYYRASRLAYSHFHDRGNSLHMGLSDSERFEPADMLAQPRFVETQWREDTRQVLELAMGRGMNALWLADRHPQIVFHGIELSPAQFRYARRGARTRPNVRPRLGDFHDLSAYDAKSMDAVFVVDALCYSTEKSRVLAEAHRVLRPGAPMIVFDGYRGRLPGDCTAEEDRAALLLARGMAVPEFEPYARFRDTCRQSPFALVAEGEYSDRILPTLRRFERLARRFLRRPRRARLLAHVLPDALVDNAVSGYLFPLLLETRVVSYWMTLLRKTD
ncbi:MAG: methyltransferase domain-containing protein [Paracoccaceae bacterium]